MPSEVPPDVPAEVTVRIATTDDADALATLFLAAREAAYPAIPRPVHPPDDVRRWVRSRFDAPECEVWLAEQDEALVGLLLLEDFWVHSLYVDPALTGQGIGSLLLDVAKHARPRRLGLWVFETNEGAQRFYRRHGFVEVDRTDGSQNEEGEPDVEMAWPDPASLQGMRGRIDDIDDRLAVLLAERAEITAPDPTRQGRARARRPRRRARGRDRAPDGPAGPGAGRGAAAPHHARGHLREPRRCRRLTAASNLRNCRRGVSASPKGVA